MGTAISSEPCGRLRQRLHKGCSEAAQQLENAASAENASLETVTASEAKQRSSLPQSPSTEEIASVAPLLRNDSFLGEEERWRCGDTRNDGCV